MTTPDRTPEGLTRIVAALLTTYPPRIATARARLADRRNPIRASGHSAGGGDASTSPPPPGLVVTDTGVSVDGEAAAADYSRLVRLVGQLSNAERGLAALLDRWAPVTPRGVAAADDVWCDNCSKYDHREPRARDGGRFCRWCADVNRRFGSMPTRKLVQLHARGITVFENVIRDELGRAS